MNIKKIETFSSALLDTLSVISTHNALICPISRPSAMEGYVFKGLHS